MTQASDRDEAGATVGDTAAGDTTRDQRGDQRSISFEEHQRVVEQAIQARVNRLNAKWQKEARQAAQDAVQGFREELGLDDQAIEEFGKWRQKKDATAPELSQLRLQLSSTTKERDLLQKQAADYAAKYRDLVTVGALRTAAMEVALPKAVSQVVAVLRDRVTLADDGSVVCLDDEGNAVQERTPADLVRQYVADNPHLAPSTSRQGTGSGTRPTAATPSNGDLREGVSAISAYDAMVSKR